MNENQKKSPKTIGGVIIALWLLMSLSGGWGLVLLVPIGLGVLVYTLTRKNNDEQNGSSQPENDVLVNLLAFRDSVQNATAQNGSSQSGDVMSKLTKFRNSMQNETGSQHGEDLGADGTFSSVPNEMLSESERYHLSVMGTASHDGIAHRTEELKDLLAAGIIERSEYNDRLHNLQAERRRTQG